MKKLFNLLIIALMSAPVFAQLNGDGYYRIQNQYTQRYVKIIDDKGSIDVATTDADFGAILTVKNFYNVASDPASIIYIKNEGTSYNLKGQGTDLYSIIGHFVKLSDNGNGTYKAYAEQSGIVKYLSDDPTLDEEGEILTNSSKSRSWYVLPVKNEGEAYFGLTPEFKVGNDYYLSIYASFPFSFTASDTKAYYVQQVIDNFAIWKEVEGVVPAATPVIVKCKSGNVTDNKVNILFDDYTKGWDGNMLKGVYFKNSNKVHYNQVANDKNVMRVLGVLPDGTIGFVKSNDDFMAANKAYLSVPEGTEDNLKFVSYEDYVSQSGVDNISVDCKQVNMGVYTILGVKISDESTTSDLRPGFYIINGKKVLVK